MRGLGIGDWGLGIEDGDPFESVLPTIGWIKANGLKSPLKEINTLDSKAPGDGYVIISTGEDSWDFYDLNEFKEEIIQQCEEIINSSIEQINQAIEQVNQAIEELKAAASSSESSGGEENSGGESSGTSTTG